MLERGTVGTRFVLRSVLGVVAIGAIVVALVVELRPDEPLAGAAAIGAVPAAIYFVATRGMGVAGQALLTILLLAYTALYLAALPSYDDDAQGGLILVFVPFWGTVALGGAWGVIAVVRSVR
jgi:hypothetical protein